MEKQFTDSPYRDVAIELMEVIAKEMGDETMFDGGKWLMVEDAVVDMLKARLGEKV